MANVFIVMSSNCEDYEDYHESIDSVWSTRGAAIAHIENDLGMTQANHKDPEKRWSRDRWQKAFPEYPQKEDFEGDEEAWRECFDKNGNLIPYYVEYRDAWILQFTMNTPTAS